MLYVHVFCTCACTVYVICSTCHRLDLEVHCTLHCHSPFCSVHSCRDSYVAAPVRPQGDGLTGKLQWSARRRLSLLRTCIKASVGEGGREAGRKEGVGRKLPQGNNTVTGTLPYLGICNAARGAARETSTTNEKEKFSGKQH